MQPIFNIKLYFVECNYQADVVFVVDSSSRSGEEWRYVKEFISSMIDNLPLIGENKVRVGLVKFSHMGFTLLGLTDTYDVDEIKQEVHDISLSTDDRATHLGLNIARESVFQKEHGDRVGVPDVLVLITDGMPSDHDETAEEAKLLKNQGVRILTVVHGAEKMSSSNFFNENAVFKSDVFYPSNTEDSATVSKSLLHSVIKTCEDNSNKGTQGARLFSRSFYM